MNTTPCPCCGAAPHWSLSDFIQYVLVPQHGSLRAVARVLDVDPGYLSRLKSGDKGDPGEALLRRMKLRRVVWYEPRRSATSGVTDAAKTSDQTCNGDA